MNWLDVLLTSCFGATPGSVPQRQFDSEGLGNSKRIALQKEEKKYYEEHPQDTLQLTPTEWTSPYGMPVLSDQHGQLHSESSETVKTSDGKFMTIPVILPDPKTGKTRYFKPKEAKKLIEKNNYINPVSGKKIKLFDSPDKAVDHAIDRDLILRDKKHPWNKLSREEVLEKQKRKKIKGEL